MKYEFFEKFKKRKKEQKEKSPIKDGAENGPSEKKPLVQKAKRALGYVLNIEGLPFYFILALLLLTVVECFARRSVAEGLLFPFRHFIPYLVNYAIILITLLPALLFHRRVAVVTLVSALWLALGVTEFVLLSFRVTPLTAVDFSILPSVISILNIYLSVFEIVLLLTLILAALVAIIFLFIKMPKVKRALKKCVISLASSATVAVLVVLSGFHINALSDTFTNLADAYNNYGFAYCFSLSLFDKGIDKPDDYSKETVDSLLGEITAGDFSSEADDPNIIFVQLESLFDVNRLKDITFSENPLPNLTELKTLYENGLLTVPVIGAGTVNTEFEVLTGMSANQFGPGEYPYKSILTDHTCETVAYTLAQSGYATHALHNHQGTFYSRDKVYQNLGFSSFTSLEYMLSPEYNDTLWAKDMVLLDEIMNVMESTEERDFVFGVTVQGHGKYPTDFIPDGDSLHVTGGLEDESVISQYNYYIQQIHETDAFVGALYEAVMAYEEPTILVFYGDHLPSLSIENEMLAEGDIYQTEYLLISNYELKTDGQLGNLHSYDLYPTVMELIGNSDGIVNRFHQVLGDDGDFLDKLQLLAYDLLYGKGYAYGSETERYPKIENMSMGTREIAIQNLRIQDGILYVTGENFTEYSVVALDGDKQDTVFVDNTLLTVALDTSDLDFSEVTVRQVTTRGEILSETDAYSK